MASFRAFPCLHHDCFFSQSLLSTLTFLLDNAFLFSSFPLSFDLSREEFVPSILLRLRWMMFHDRPAFSIGSRAIFLSKTTLTPLPERTSQALLQRPQDVSFAAEYFFLAFPVKRCAFPPNLLSSAVLRLTRPCPSYIFFQKAPPPRAYSGHGR